MPRVNLFNWTVFAYFALLAIVGGFGMAWINSVLLIARFSMHDALLNTLRLFVVAVIWVFLNRFIMRPPERDAWTSAKSKPGQSGDLAEL
jgi:hypothetical protein